jgi:hypothetical protein
LVLIKDVSIAIPSIIVIFLSSSSLFNSRFCWSGFFYYHSSARVPLNINPFYDYKDDTMYPAIVAICLFLQIFTFAFIAISWRDGLRVMRWGEKARQEEWERARNVEAKGDNEYCIRKCEIGKPSGSENKRRKRQEKTHKCCQCINTEMIRIHNDSGESESGADITHASEEGALEERSMQEPSLESEEIVARSPMDAA